MRKILVAAVVVVSAAASACSTESEPPPEESRPSATPKPSSSSSSTAADQPSSDPEAADLLAAAVAVTADVDVIGFTYELRFLDDPISETVGVQRMSGGWSASSTFTDPTGSSSGIDLSMESRSSNGTTWMQMAAWPAPMSGCWMQMGAGEVPVGIYGLQPDEVGYVSILAGLSALEIEDGSGTTVAAELELASAQLLVQGRALEQVEIDAAAAADVRVPATVEIENGRVDSVQMLGQDFADAITEAGGNVGDEATLALTTSDAVVTYTPSPAGEVAEPPTDELVVTQDQAKKGCH